MVLESNTFRRCKDSELPDGWGPECDDFRVVCSNGFVGSLGLESVFLHKPSSWPQCFPDGADGDCVCEVWTEMRVGA